MLQLTRENPENPGLPLVLDDSRPAQSLKNEHAAEVLDFLASHPLSSFVMSGWLRDNGVVSLLNRGTFYACRNARGELEGVALIGHITLFETTSDGVLAAFASLTQTCPSARIVLGAQDAVSRFLSYYTRGGLPPRRVCRELLFEQRSKERLNAEMIDLRRATLGELELVVPVHAQMVREELGIDPMKTDPAAFRDRCARRIHQGRVWVCVEDKGLTFKADIISDLPEINYIEGVYVSPEKRGQGYGARCMRQLTNTLLTHTRSVCLLAKEQSLAAQSCYRKAGYKLRDYYETVLLREDSDEQAH
jgi:ribosomal protein S18 acetylase RimI-like enzyme